MNSCSQLRFSFEDLRVELEKIRGKMPRSTLYHWLEKMKIHPDLDGYYDLNDLEILKQLNRFLLQHRSIEKFRNLLIREYKNAGRL